MAPPRFSLWPRVRSSLSLVMFYIPGISFWPAANTIITLGVPGSWMITLRVHEWNVTTDMLCNERITTLRSSRILLNDIFGQSTALVVCWLPAHNRSVVVYITAWISISLQRTHFPELHTFVWVSTFLPPENKINNITSFKTTPTCVSLHSLHISARQ